MSEQSFHAALSLDAPNALDSEICLTIDIAISNACHPSSLVCSTLPLQNPVTVNDPPGLDCLHTFAKALYDARRRRSDLLPAAVGEPGWDILLEAFSLNGPISIKQACLAANVPPTTALRWIDVLEVHLLLTRYRDNVDKRRFYLELTDFGRSTVVAVLEEKARIIMGLF